MKAVHFIFSAVLAVISLPSNGEASTCQGVYTDSVRNINISTRLQVEQSSVFNEHCEANGSMKSSSSKLDLSVPIKTLTNKIGLSQDQQQQEMQQFCKTAKDESYRNNENFNMSNTVVVDALRSYNQCIALEKKNVQIAHTTNEESIVIRIDFNPTTSVVEFNSISFDQKRASCTSTILGDGAKPIAFSTGKVTAKVPFVISCQRTPEITDRGKNFSRVSFLLSTNHGDYEAVMAPENLFNFDKESIFRQYYSTSTEVLKKEQDATKKLSAIIASMSQSAQFSANEIATLKSKMKNPDAQVFSVMQGEGSPIPCPQDGGDHLNYIKNSCNAPGVLSVLKKTPEVGGGKCGYRTWQWACVNYR